MSRSFRPGVLDSRPLSQRPCPDRRSAASCLRFGERVAQPGPDDPHGAPLWEADALRLQHRHRHLLDRRLALSLAKHVDRQPAKFATDEIGFGSVETRRRFQIGRDRLVTGFKVGQLGAVAFGQLLGLLERLVATRPGAEQLG